MPTQEFHALGLTCAHCVGAVSEEVFEISGVTAVDIDLVAGGASELRVESEVPLDDDQIAAALDEAGDYVLAGPPDPAST